MQRDALPELEKLVSLLAPDTSLVIGESALLRYFGAFSYRQGYVAARDYAAANGLNFKREIGGIGRAVRLGRPKN